MSFRLLRLATPSDFHLEAVERLHPAAAAAAGALLSRGSDGGAYIGVGLRWFCADRVDRELLPSVL